jgi:hypothetical protein
VAATFYAGTPAQAAANLARAETLVRQRRETEAQLEREHTQARAAFAERERRLREAGAL